MPLDTSIIGQDIAPKFVDPQNMLAKHLQLQNAQQEYQNNAIKMQQEQQGYAQQNALSQWMSNPSNNIGTAAGQASAFGVGGMKATAAIKAHADNLKTNAETGKISAEGESKVIGLHRDELANVGTPQQMAQWMVAIRQDPRTTDFYSRLGSAEDAIARIPQTPQEFNEFRQKIAMGMTKYTEQNKPQFITSNLGDRTNTVGVEGLTGKTNLINSAQNGQSPDNAASNARMAADAAASRGVTMRGQNMTDARSRESNSASMSKPFEVAGDDGKPVLVRQDKQGNITRVEGFGPKSGTEKPMTDAQSKAALFGSRMQESNAIINDLAKAGTQKSIPGTNAGFGIAGAVNIISSEKQQQLAQAKRDFINAVLRRESGAVISPTEFDNGEKQYFPQIGDEPSVIKQKASNRAIATRGVQAEIPKAQRGVVNEIIGNKSANIDSLLDKYK